MIFWEIAKRNIRIHLLRSSLAMLGIVIGVVAIASMGILGNSLVLTVSDSLKTVGDSVIVTPHVGGTMRGFGGAGGGYAVPCRTPSIDVAPSSPALQRCVRR